MHTFTFHSPWFDNASATVHLPYQYDDGPILTERFCFRAQDIGILDDGRKAALDEAIRLLHQIAGVSYYKSWIPKKIVFADHPPSPERAQFLQQTYEHGLAEFAYVNQLDLVGKIPFPHSNACNTSANSISLKHRYVVPFGGGKDSSVSAEIIKKAGLPVAAIQVGESGLIRDVIAASGLPRLYIKRILSPVLGDYHAQGAYNGHVPVTAILSAAFLVAGILYDFDTLVMSNEASANIATLTTTAGTTVNHQYSKSLQFEQSFSDIVSREIMQNWRYFSLLRGYNELTISQRFAQFPQYFSVFSSCNRNFHIDGSRVKGRWCKACPKCRFVFLALAPSLPKSLLIDIFGGNLLDDATQISGFADLLGEGDHKPLECVGDIEESRAALGMLAEIPEWRQCKVVQAFSTAQWFKNHQYETLCSARYGHAIPEALSGYVP